MEFTKPIGENRRVLDGVYNGVRHALNRAIEEGQRVSLVLRADLLAGVSVRTLEGVPYEISPGRDGRERVFLRVAEETEQIVLVERVMRVLTAVD
jgi:hypothetical protein